MTEPVSSSIVTVTTVGGVTIFGIATGLHPVLLFAGAWGGWWAQSFMDPAPIFTRLNRVAISAGVAAWASKGLVNVGLGLFATNEKVLNMQPAELLAAESLVALCLGLLAMPVLGRGAIQVASRFLDKKFGGDNG